jgi:MtN3 and saliva related transmembrane protein
MHFSLELIGYIAAFCTTASFLPQALLTIRSNDTQSLSLGMYSLFTTGVLFWLVYGFYKHDLALIWANAITLLLAATILGFKIRSLLKRD